MLYSLLHYALINMYLGIWSKTTVTCECMCTLYCTDRDSRGEQRAEKTVIKKTVIKKRATKTVLHHYIAGIRVNSNCSKLLLTDLHPSLRPSDYLPGSDVAPSSSFVLVMRWSPVHDVYDRFPRQPDPRTPPPPTPKPANAPPGPGAPPI